VPDLAVFNGTIVDSENRPVRPHFRLPSRRYLRMEDAFDDLRDKGMFGAVLVKATHVGEAHFKALFGTAHGYGCYWFSLMAEHLHGRTPVILIPDFPLVALRMAAKTYNHVDVYYRDIPYEIAVYQRHLPTGLPQRLNDGFRKRYLRKVSSLLFLTQLCTSGSDIRRIRDIDPSFHRRHRLKIAVASAFAETGAYAALRDIYRSLAGRKKETT
jgi:hypothetical protein